jgi:ankyrin repeat protein
MAAGANLDATGADGQTALDIAIKSKDEPLVKILTNQS